MSVSAASPSPIRASDYGVCTASAQAAGATQDDDGFSFHDLLDIVNPLQHIPIVNTLYRNLTGDQINTVPKLAGDALYGGPLGLASSAADTAFQKLTGRSVGDTLIAFADDIFGSSDAGAPATGLAANAPIDTTATAVASNAPALPAPDHVQVAALDTILVPGQDALLSALGQKGVTPEIALRASEAYRRTLTVAAAAANPLPEPMLRASLAE